MATRSTPTDLITVAEAAALVDRATRTIEQRIKRGSITGYAKFSQRQGRDVMAVSRAEISALYQLPTTPRPEQPEPGQPEPEKKEALQPAFMARPQAAKPAIPLDEQLKYDEIVGLLEITKPPAVEITEAIEAPPPPPTDFIKHDNDKLEWHLLPIEPIEELIKVLMHGAEKYEPHNWQKGADYNRYYNAALRHLTAWWRGEDIDPDSGINHLSHAMCNLTFLRWYQEHKPEFDNRPGAK